MNIINIEKSLNGSFTVYAEINGFEHSCEIDYKIAKDLTDGQVLAIAETEILEAYERFIEV